LDSLSDASSMKPTVHIWCASDTEVQSFIIHSPVAQTAASIQKLVDIRDKC